MIKILITGGDSFLAKSFVEKLDGDYDIISCDRAALDLNDSAAVADFLKAQRFDVVIHTATYDAAPKDSPKDRNKVLENNLTMFFNLARCKADFGKMLYFGSGAEFSRDKWMPDMSESYFDKFVPTDQYGLSKYVMTQHALTTDKIFNLRLFSVFGEYDDWRYRFISNTCCHAVMGRSINVHQNARADFLFIDDLVRIVQWFIENKPKYQTYNVCSGNTYEYVSLANIISEIAHNKTDVAVNNIEIRKEYSGDNSRLVEELGGFEFTPIEQALELLYNWYQNNKQIIDETKFHF
ncbi:MAG: NAD(P)-dependent oxidoreductase [Flavobacteriales bacterium]|nr:NAD(P)-dependent oxidoreductase [Flavobacteriales bacterium]